MKPTHIYVFPCQFALHKTWTFKALYCLIDRDNTSYNFALRLKTHSTHIILSIAGIQIILGPPDNLQEHI